MQDNSIKNEIALAWKVLYDQPFDEIPDPNKPENTARLNILKKQKQEALQRLVDGPFKPIMADWKDQIRRLNLWLLFGTDVNECSCKTCAAIRNIRSKLQLMQEIQQSLEKKED